MPVIYIYKYTHLAAIYIYKLSMLQLLHLQGVKKCQGKFNINLLQ